VKAPHLLRVTAPPAVFAPLVAAARGAGLRVGWLALAPPEGLPAELGEAAGCGVLRAVAAGEGRSVAVKPLAGPPVLGDLLREHFRGCALVLVRGEVEAPLLAAEGDGWRLEPAAGEAQGPAPLRLSNEQLVARLRRPRPW
jgi:hypothetical protein